MPKIQFTIDSDVPADRVFAAITDFSDDRPRLWPAISRDVYELHGQGENWAECTEGGDDFGGVWAKERYEWSPGEVRATVVDSNIFKSGTWVMKVEPRDGGSHIEVLNHRKVKGKGRAIAPILMVAGGPLLKKQFQRTLEVLRAESGAREKTTV
jgi:Polyketide cyclase / dehydrase and lipid transport